MGLPSPIYALAPIAKCKTDERSILNAQEDARIQRERDKKQYEKDRAAMYAEREKTNAFLRKHGYTVDFWCRGQRVVRWQNSCLTCV